METPSGLKILICDDNFSYRKMQKDILSKHFEVAEIIQAGRAEEVFDLLEQNQDIDLIMMDINLPGMDGIEAVGKIRSKFNEDQFSIIMCSTLSEKQRVMKALRSGAQDYIIKPFPESELIEKVRKYL